MNKTLNKIFSEKVNRYKNALLSCAERSDWDSFKINASKLFDYIESIEMSEIERRFLKVSKTVMAVLFLLIFLILKMNLNINPEILRIREVTILIAIAGSCFELYFYINYRLFMENKVCFYKKRKDQFIYGIEKDFKNYLISRSGT